jgi:hypothetical protein
MGSGPSPSDSDRRAHDGSRWVALDVIAKARPVMVVGPGECTVHAGVTAKKWAKGTLFLGQAFTAGDDGYTLGGRLSFAAGIELEVTAAGTLGYRNAPASFESTGTGTAGKSKRAIYQLTGWVFAEEPVEGAGRVVSIRGSVRAVRGPDTKPETELGGLRAVTTVGSFAVTRAS